MAPPSLEPVAEKYAEQGVQSIFVYTREAHTGENYPHLTSFEQKLDHARAFRDLFGIKRPILVDDLEGTIHRQYGLLSNMSFVISGTGQTFYKANWTDVDSIVVALEYMLTSVDKRQNGVKLAPFYSEMLGQRHHDFEKLQEGLVRAGPRGLRDGDSSLWLQGETRGGRLAVPSLVRGG